MHGEHSELPEVLQTLIFPAQRTLESNYVKLFVIGPTGNLSEHYY